MNIALKYRPHISTGLLIALMVLENAFLYYFFRNGILTQGVNAIGLFLSSILFGIVLIYKFYNASIQNSPKLPAKKNIVPYVMILLVIAGLVSMGIQFNVFVHSHGISYTTSDIIPEIQIMCRRFLKGLTPYCVFRDFGYPMETGYLPMHWMPFTIAELLHVDYRWITYYMWCIAALWLCLRSIKIPSITFQIIVPLIVFGSYYVLYNNANWIVESTVELMISGYYMMLILSLNQKNGILQGIIFSLCLLSRYSVVLWIPLYCFVMYLSKNRRQLYLAAATAVIMIIAFYIVPFLSKDWGMFYRVYKNYDAAALFEWTHLNDTGKPIQLFSGTGYAYYFYTRFPSLDITARIKLLQRTDLICSLLVTVLMGVWFWFKKEKIDYKIFLLASFKIYLSVFLFLIQVPYEYLMCVGNFVTIAIFCEQARYRVVSSKS